MVVTVCSTEVIVCSTVRLKFGLQKKVQVIVCSTKICWFSLFYYEREDVEQT